MKFLGVELPKMIAELCPPAQVYLLLSVLGQLIYLGSMIHANNTVLDAEPEGGSIHHYAFFGFIVNIVFVVIWVALLNYICKFKYGKKIAWFLVLFPIIFFCLLIIGLLLSLGFIAEQTIKNKELLSKLIK